MLPSPVLRLRHGTVKPLIMWCWELTEVLKLRVCSKLVVGSGVHYPCLLNARPVRAHPAVAHEAPQLQGLTAPSPPGPFQSPCVLASWTSCVRTASSASSSPWCVTASSSAGTALTRIRSSQDAVSRGAGETRVGHPRHVPPSSFQVSTEGPDLRFLRKAHLGCFGSLLVSRWCTAQGGGVKVDRGLGPRVTSFAAFLVPQSGPSPCRSVCAPLTSTLHTGVILAGLPSWCPRAGPCLVHGYSPVPKTALPA